MKVVEAKGNTVRIRKEEGIEGSVSNIPSFFVNNFNGVLNVMYC